MERIKISDIPEPFKSSFDSKPQNEEIERKKPTIDFNALLFVMIIMMLWE
ncbi:MAG: hypothetical protein FWC69_03885 [Defluviitaleaceae bacterium]|nr:hypothetical protein [Defluviitaleaceae bacterium]